MPETMAKPKEITLKMNNKGRLNEYAIPKYRIGINNILLIERIK